MATAPNWKTGYFVSTHWDYVAETVDEISAQVGEKMMVAEDVKADSPWLLLKKADGSVGYMPISYLKLISTLPQKPLARNLSSSSSSPSSPSSPRTENPSSQPSQQVSSPSPSSSMPAGVTSAGGAVVSTQLSVPPTQPNTTLTSSTESLPLSGLSTTPTKKPHSHTRKLEAFASDPRPPVVPGKRKFPTAPPPSSSSPLSAPPPSSSSLPSSLPLLPPSSHSTPSPAPLPSSSPSSSHSSPSLTISVSHPPSSSFSPSPSHSLSVSASSPSKSAFSSPPSHPPPTTPSLPAASTHIAPRPSYASQTQNPLSQSLQCPNSVSSPSHYRERSTTTTSMGGGGGGGGGGERKAGIRIKVKDPRVQSEMVSSSSSSHFFEGTFDEQLSQETNEKEKVRWQPSPQRSDSPSIQSHVDFRQEDLADTTVRTTGVSTESILEQKEKTFHNLAHWLADRPTVEQVAKYTGGVHVVTSASGANKTKTKDSLLKNVFGMSLQDIFSNGDGTSIPICVIQCVDYLMNNDGLNLVGIFRISGNQYKMLCIREAYHTPKSKVNLSGEDLHDVAGILKMFYSDLPEPVFTYASYDKFIANCKCENEEQRNEIYTKLLNDLPELNAIAIRFLFEFLYRVSLNAETNKMTATNLGVCFGPSLLRPLVPTPDQLMLAPEKTCVEQLVEAYPVIFSNVGLTEISKRWKLEAEEKEKEKKDKGWKKMMTTKRLSVIPKSSKGSESSSSSSSSSSSVSLPPSSTSQSYTRTGQERPVSFHSVDLSDVKEKSMSKSLSIGKIPKFGIKK